VGEFNSKLCQKSEMKDCILKILFDVNSQHIEELVRASNATVPILPSMCWKKKIFAWSAIDLREV